jgi:hypothetical protein
MSQHAVEAWFADETAIAEFRSALNNPYVRKGLDLIMRIGLPANSTVPQGADLLEWGALTNASREGYFMALKNIEALATLPTKGEKNPLPHPWEYLLAGEQQTQQPEAPQRRSRRKSNP